MKTIKNLLKLIIEWFKSYDGGPPMNICDECGYDNLGWINIKECKNCGNKLE